MKIKSPLPVFTLQPTFEFIPFIGTLNPFSAQANTSPPFVVILPQKSMAFPLYPFEPIDGPLPTVKPFQV